MLAVTCLLAASFAFGEAPVRQAPVADMTTPSIPGVVAAGTKVALIWTGSESADGLMGAPDGSLLVPHQAASRIGRIDKDGKVSVYLENTNGTGGIGLDPKGRLISVERSTSQIRCSGSVSRRVSGQLRRHAARALE